MPVDRHVAWDGLLNARDLGGLPAAGGARTAFGAVVRSDHPSQLTAAGWDALVAYGIRTIVTLTTAGVDPDDLPELPGRPDDLTVIRIDIEDGRDAGFADRWAANGLWATPLYYADAIQRWPERCAAAVMAVVRAEPGGVLVHCTRGCDRTGIVALMLLALVGVAPEPIAADHALSPGRLRPREPDYPEWLEATMAGHGTTTIAVIEAMVREVDIEGTLRGGGLTDDDLAALRRRLLEPDHDSSERPSADESPS